MQIIMENLRSPQRISLQRISIELQPVLLTDVDETPAPLTLDERLQNWGTD